MILGTTTISNIRLGNSAVIRIILGNRQVWPVSILDPDAQAFLNAAGITDFTITTAINDLVIGLKSNSLWDKMRAIYPFVGGTATTHRWNLKDPRDLNAAFRLTFNGGFIHNSNGIIPGGLNGWANTFLNPSSLINNNTHMSYFSRTAPNRNSIEIGSQQDFGATLPRFGVSLAFGGTFASDQYNFGSDRVATSNSNTANGYYIATRTSNVSHKAFKNGVQFGTTNTTPSTTTITSLNTPIALFGLNSTHIGGPVSGLYSSRTSSFISIGDGLSDSECVTLNTLVNNFQTTLGRPL